MTQSLRDLLTSPSPGGGEPLFESAAVLAAQISQDKNRRFRSAQTVATLLSNLLRGHRPCSEELAAAILAATEKRLTSATAKQKKTVLDSIAQAIESANTSFRARIASKAVPARAEISAGKEISAIEVPQEVPDLFERVGKGKGLICVEYRDYPRAYSEGKYQKLALDAGKAIAAGACFAMFDPYGEGYRQEEPYYHTLEVRNYIQVLGERVRDAFFCILTAALADCSNEAEKQKIAQRIILYQRGIPSEVPCQAFLAAGIQSRLFYAEIPVPEARADQEVWEWVATGRETDDIFVQRREDSIPQQVVREQFFPIVRVWKKHGELLTSNDDIEKAISLYNKHAGAQLPGNFWTVFLTPEEAVRKVKELEQKP